MPRAGRTPLDDDSGISGMAAMIALGGHAAVILAILLLAGRAPEITVTPNAVRVTLVSGEAGAAARGPQKPMTPFAPTSTPATTPASDTVSAGEQLDRLTEIATLSPTSVSATVAGRSEDAPPRAASGGGGRSGSSRADQGLGQGEGAVGVDLYAAASLPEVGARPPTPPAGDLWRKVAPCWRRAAPRPTTLVVTLQADGALAGAPQAVRRRGAPVDALSVLAERAAVRAVQACAPYADLDTRQWRVEFP